MTTVLIEEFAVSGGEPYSITTGPDGALWAALEIGTLARITPNPASKHRRKP